jgi:8-oxo-dGTP diphosphatase
LVEIVNGLLVRSNQVLLARRTPQRKTWPDCWSFPGGHVEPGETLDEALERELAEEIGVEATNWTALTTLEHIPGLITFHLFAVTGWLGEPTLLGDEHSELRWASFSEAAELPNLALKSYGAVFGQLAADSQTA